MKIGALALFEPMQANGDRIPGRVLAVWHWRRSITWRWVLDWTPRAKGMPFGLHRWGNAQHPNVLLRLPLLGEIHFAAQPNCFPRTYPLKGFPLRGVKERRDCIQRREQCPECGGMLDTGNECNECGFDAFGDLQGLRAVSSPRGITSEPKP